VEYLHGWPAYPAEHSIELLPRVTASLASSVQPFVEQPRELVSEVLAHEVVIRDGIVIQISFQHTCSPPHDYSCSKPASPVLDFCLECLQLGFEFLLGCPSLHLEASIPSLPAVMGETQKIKLLRLLAPH